MSEVRRAGLPDRGRPVPSTPDARSSASRTAAICYSCVHCSRPLLPPACSAIPRPSLHQTGSGLGVSGFMV